MTDGELPAFCQELHGEPSMPTCVVRRGAAHTGCSEDGAMDGSY